MEEELVPKAGYELVTFPAMGMARGKSFKALKRNVNAIKCVISAINGCKKIIREL